MDGVKLLRNRLILRGTEDKRERAARPGREAQRLSFVQYKIDVALIRVEPEGFTDKGDKGSQLQCREVGHCASRLYVGVAPLFLTIGQVLCRAKPCVAMGARDEAGLPVDVFGAERWSAALRGARLWLVKGPNGGRFGKALRDFPRADRG